MKKTLLTSMLIVGSFFSSYAQFKIGSSTINVGEVRIPAGGQQSVIINPQGGQVGFTGPNGQVQMNTNTGAVGIKAGGSGFGINAVFGGNGSTGSNGFSQRSGLLGLLDLVKYLVVSAVPLLVGIALLAFFWYLIEFIWKGREDAAAKSRSGAGMAYSILALFVMVSIWGIIGFFGNTLGIEQGGSICGFSLPGEESKCPKK